MSNFTKPLMQVVFVLASIIPITSLGQNNSYYTFGNDKIDLIPIGGKYIAEFPNGINPEDTTYPGQKISDKIYLVIDTNNLGVYSSTYNVFPTFLTDDGEIELYITSNILLKFKSSASTAAKQNIITQNNLQFIKSGSTYEMYSCINPLIACQSIYESGIVEFCHPDFISNTEQTSIIPNDEYFSKQWYLHNTGQGTNDGKSTTINADINAPEAWDLTLGDPNLVIAVIDGGITSNHPDLPNTRQLRLNGSNFAWQYDGSNDPDDPSPTSSDPYKNHGNGCAGIIGASHNNSIGISGIAPNCKILPVKIQHTLVPFSTKVDAINFASLNADILSNSWGWSASQPNLIPAVVVAVKAAIGNGKIVLFAAGNRANHIINNKGLVHFPGNTVIDNLIVVGASDRNDAQANYSPTDDEIDIVAPSHSAYNHQITGEAYNVWTIDITGNGGDNTWYDTWTTLPAYGEFLPSTGSNPHAYTGRFGGTSAACPQVAGVSALMLSVNPCLSPFQVKDLLQKTANKVVPYNYYWNSNAPGHSKEMGYGRLDAYKAVKAAQDMHSNTLDLYMRDTKDDLGFDAGYDWTWNMDDSPDIWVRNQNDGLTNQTHENPEYQANSPVYVYVRVGNKSCVPSSGAEQLALHWSKASTNNAWASSYLWANNWNGVNPTIGDLISFETIPVLQPGESTILTFTWNIPPGTGIGSTWNISLLARIVYSQVDITTYYPHDLMKHVYHNNNVAMRNSVVTDYIPGIYPNGSGNERERSFFIGNPHGVSGIYDIILRNPENCLTPITEVAEVNVELDQQGWNLLSSKLVGRADIIIKDNYTFSIVGNNPVHLDSITFSANTRVPVKIVYNFLTDEVEDLNTYSYHVLQKYSQPDSILGDHWTGGVHFTVNKGPRDLFDADAGNDQEIDKGDSTILTAEQINEAAQYNWYDSNGDLIYSGTSLSVSPNITEKYKLEVIADADGFKDYAEVEVTVNKYKLTSLNPNPASTNVTINYDVDGANSAYLMIVGTTNYSTSNNYLLNTTQTQTIINVSNFQLGIYTVALVVDGQVVDAKSLMIQ